MAIYHRVLPGTRTISGVGLGLGAQTIRESAGEGTGAVNRSFAVALTTRNEIYTVRSFKNF
jgi:hypothetical protein